MLRQWLIGLMREAVREELLRDRAESKPVPVFPPLADSTRPEVKMPKRARTFLEWTDQVNKERG